MSLLDHPKAQALLKDATVTPESVEECGDRLVAYLGRYLPRFRRKEQRENATLIVRGLISGLERKTCEPIAYASRKPRKPLQSFVGGGAWDDTAVMAELLAHVGEEIGEKDAVLIIDSSSFPKKGTESCGVARQWCGRIGKVENCQVGVFLAYASSGGCALLDRQLFLPKDWANNPTRRQKCHVPEMVEFQTKWQIAADLVARCTAEIPHGWVVGDDDFGRAAELRALLREREERYVLDVPCDTLVRDLERRRPPRRRGRGGTKREVPFCRVDEWARQQSPSRWTRVTVRAGEKGPLEFDVMSVRVRAKLEERIGPEERLLVMRTVEANSQIFYALSNADPTVPVSELARVRSQRHRIEELFEAGNGEAGLDHYEVRSWIGWHHHITLSLLALWFLSLERRQVGKKKPGRYGVADAANLHEAAPRPPAKPKTNRRRGYPSAAAERGIKDLSLAQEHKRLSTTPSP